MSDPIRIYVAIDPDEYRLFFDEVITRRVKRLGTVEFGAPSQPVSVPSNLADSFDVLLTSWSTAPFDPVLVCGKRLRLAVHLGASVRGLFPKHVLGGGLRVVQAGAAAMAVPVAEMALTMTLAMLRNLHIHDRTWQATRDWQAGGNGMLGRGLTSQRIGIIGLSRTGKEYATMIRALGAHDILAYDPYVSSGQAANLGVDLVDIDTLCRTCSVVAVHAPATSETQHLLNAPRLASMSDGTIIVNTARSCIVHEAALINEVNSGRLQAALDVFDTEPLPADSALFGLPNVLITPHVAGGTVTARRQQGAIAVAEIQRYLNGEDLHHEVTEHAYDRLG